MMSDQSEIPVNVADLLELLRTRQHLRVSHDPPARAGGEHYVDVNWPGGGAEICWSEARGFELSSVELSAVFGEGHDERYSDEKQVVARIDMLISGDRTRPSIGAWLGEIRRAAGLSQQDLADRLGVSQSAVAQQEKRGDVSVSLLARTCGASGGQLSVSALIGSTRLDWGSVDAAAPKRSLECFDLVPAEGNSNSIPELPAPARSIPPLRRSLGAKQPPANPAKRRMDSDPSTLELA